MAATRRAPAASARVPAADPLPIRLMNTVWSDGRGTHDTLSTPAGLALFLAQAGLLDAGPDAVTGEALAAGRRLRDALRRLAALCTADPRPRAASPLQDLGEAIAQVNSAAAACPAVPRLSFERGALRRGAGQGPPVAAALAAIAAQAADVLTGPEAEKLRACSAPGCVRYFVKEHPRREWCSAACGNRVRAARHYRRRHPISVGLD